MKDTKVLIIGGGISGLSTAWWLVQQGIAVELWEADDQPGGKIRSTREQGYLSERAAGLLVNFRPEIDRMIHAAGLDSSRCSRNDDLKRYVLHRDRLAQVPMTFSGMALSPLWSRQAKLRMASEILVPRGGHEQESVSDFITRRLGREILDTAIDPFISGTLASDPARASARAILPRLTELEQRYGSITLGMLISRLLKRRRANNADAFSFRQGMSGLIQTLAATPGIRLRCGLKVKRIAREGDGWRVDADGSRGQRSLSTTQLVITAPANVAATLTSELDEVLSTQLGGIEYAPLAVLHLGLRQAQIQHPLDGTGFLVPGRSGLNLNGNLWMSNLFPQRAPEGQALLTSYLGGSRHPEQPGWSDGKIVSRVLSDLSPLLGISGEPHYVRIDRHPRGLPLYYGNYPLRIQTIRDRLNRLPGLHLNANYLDGVSVRERIYQGSKCAQTIAAALRSARSSQDDWQMAFAGTLPGSPD